MRDRLPQRPQIGLLPLHLRNECQVVYPHLCPAVLLLVRQDLSRLTHQVGRNLATEATGLPSPAVLWEAQWDNCFKAGGKLFFPGCARWSR